MLKVICIDNEGVISQLTKGKSYEILPNGIFYNDQGNPDVYDWYRSSRWITVEDNRNNKIGELLGEKVCASNDVPTIKAEVNRYRELTLLGLIR